MTSPAKNKSGRSGFPWYRVDLRKPYSSGGDKLLFECRFTVHLKGLVRDYTESIYFEARKEDRTSVYLLFLLRRESIPRAFGEDPMGFFCLIFFPPDDSRIICISSRRRCSVYPQPVHADFKMIVFFFQNARTPGRQFQNSRTAHAPVCDQVEDLFLLNDSPLIFTWASGTEIPIRERDGTAGYIKCE